MDISPFFIVGVGRSGTTLLRLMMNSHPEIAIPYETHFITDYYTRSRDYGDLTQPENMNRILDDILSEEMIKKWDHQMDTRQIIPLIDKRDLNGAFSAIYKSYANSQHKKYWGDKSDYLDRMDIINKIFPAAKFIHIIRDGRDVANSVMSMPWGPNDIMQAAEWWNEHIKLGCAMGSMLSAERYTEVKYEELVLEPEHTLKKLCSFIGVTYSSKMLDYHQSSASTTIPAERKFQHYNSDKTPQKSRVYAWQKTMADIDIATFNSLAKDSLTKLGYSLDPTTTSHQKLAFYKLKILIGRYLKRKNLPT